MAPSWITLDEACSLLGVRPQTLYAYASRGKIEVAPDPVDSRRSLYRAEDVRTLARRKLDGRKPATLARNAMFGAEPSIPTALCSFSRGRLCYRGQDAVELARAATLEDVAELLWNAGHAVQLHSAEPTAHTGREGAFLLLARRTAHGHSTRGRTPRALREEAQDLVGQVAQAFGAARGEPGPLHLRLAQGWGLGRPVAELLRRAMVLLADHELTSSAFASRIAASTGASLPACLLAGLATFSGPLHGDASGRVRSLLDEVGRLGPEVAIQRYLSAGWEIPGFGHHLYPDGDPRAASLLALFEPPKAISRFIASAQSLTGLQPNIDLALAALVARYRLPADAAFAVFATSRSVGLLAHAMEQLAVPQVIRPRGRYTGLEPGIPSSPQAGSPGHTREP